MYVPKMGSNSANNNQLTLLNGIKNMNFNYLKECNESVIKKTDSLKSLINYSSKLIFFIIDNMFEVLYYLWIPTVW